MIRWADRIITSGFYLLFFLVPLILTPINYELFEYNKMMTVYVLTTIITSAWILKMIAEKEISIRRTPLDIPIALFVSSQLLSSLFSIDSHVSWFGYYSRFNGGMWSVISYVLLYYAFVSNEGSNIHKHLKTLLASASFVALYGVLERLGIDKHLWVQDVQTRVFSTLGQPNWLAAFLVALIPTALAFTLKSRIWNLKFLLWIFVAMLFFTVLLFTRSRSGLFGLCVADVVFWGLLSFCHFERSEKSLADAKHGTSNKLRDPSTALGMTGKNILFPFIICHLAFGIILFINGTNIDLIDKYFSLEGWKNLVNTSSIHATPKPSPTPSYTAPLLETGGTESGTIRKYVWQGAIAAWKSSTKAFFIGTGTETFALAFFQYRPVGHNMTSEWDFLYNKAHNEYLNYLATTGIFGLGSYLLFISVFMVWFIKVHSLWFIVHSQDKKNVTMNHELLTINFALLAGWLSILVTNFFGFSVVVVQLLFFLFPAMIISSTTAQERESESIDLFYYWPIPKVFTLFSTTIVITVTSLILYFIANFWTADTRFAKGYRYNRAEMFDKAEEMLASAIAINPIEPLYHDEHATSLAGLAMTAIEAQDATHAAQFAKLSLEESDRALTISPHNVNYWKTRTKIYYTFASFDPALNKAAIQALEKAQSLSPNDPKILYNLAILYGREDDNAQAITLLEQAVAMKPNYRDVYWALSVFYKEAKQPAKAKEVLNQYLKLVDPNDKEFIEAVK